MSAFTKAVVSQFYRLQGIGIRTLHTQAQPLCFHQTNVVNGVPVKKKKRFQIYTSEQLRRKKKFFDTELHRHRRLDRILKPVEEIDIHPRLRRETLAGMRTREKAAMSTAEVEEEVMLHKDWARYRMKEFLKECRIINRVIKSQEKALAKLREESEELYQQAIQLDENLLSYSFNGPVETPPIEDFDPVDGDYIDITNYFMEKKKKM